jgi:RNA polymerase sigma-70 factor (ECF subfamily)
MTTPPSTRQDVTQLLGDWSGGDEGALEKLFPLVHSELHRLAHHYMSHERAGHTLQKDRDSRRSLPAAGR